MARPAEFVRGRIRAGRERGSWIVRALDLLRDLRSPAGRGRLQARLLHGQQQHQTTEHTEPDRYPAIFNRAALQVPEAARILSFGCSTGEEIAALRSRFPNATIVGAEINPNSRKIAAAKFEADPNVRIVKDYRNEPPFDVVFAMAVLQFQPHMIERRQVRDLSALYPFYKFEAEIFRLIGSLKSGGLFCIMHAHYRAEDTSVAGQLQALAGAPLRTDHLFQPNGLAYAEAPPTGSMFAKR